ncbi:hypothetical protein HGRIS_000729 [Hohenbuehelia grisea]|uniref:Uncharacterized protein n=1 Tax=Hohenbuehelia grisea TaxID=104357 RepID=A0ABR3IPJ7_9AGAR
MRPVLQAAPLRQFATRPVTRAQRSFTIRRAGQRFASSSTNPSVEATQKKAQDALGSLQKNAEKIWGTTKKLLEPVTDKAGQLLGYTTLLLPNYSHLFCVIHVDTYSYLSTAAYKEPLVYNFSVARELVKQVYRAEGLQPPTSAETIKQAYSTLWSRASNPGYWRGIASSGEIARVGIYAVEAYTIFKVCRITAASGHTIFVNTRAIRSERSLVAEASSDTICTDSCIWMIIMLIANQSHHRFNP